MRNFFTGQEKQFSVNINIKEKATEASKLSPSEHSHKSKQYNQMPTQSQTNSKNKPSKSSNLQQYPPR